MGGRTGRVVPCRFDSIFEHTLNNLAAQSANHKHTCFFTANWIHHASPHLSRVGPRRPARPRRGANYEEARPHAPSGSICRILVCVYWCFICFHAPRHLSSCIQLRHAVVTRQGCMHSVQPSIHTPAILMAFSLVDLQEPGPPARTDVRRIEAEPTERFHSRACHKGDAKGMLRGTDVYTHALPSPALALVDRSSECQAKRKLGA